jgi:hypothetical protein
MRAAHGALAKQGQREGCLPQLLSCCGDHGRVYLQELPARLLCHILVVSDDLELSCPWVGPGDG